MFQIRVPPLTFNMGRSTRSISATYDRHEVLQVILGIKFGNLMFWRTGMVARSRVVAKLPGVAVGGKRLEGAPDYQSAEKKKVGLWL